MIEIKKLGIEHFEPIVAFDKLCFPTDFWKEEDFKELLSDERTTYYAAMAALQARVFGNPDERRHS